MDDMTVRYVVRMLEPFLQSKGHTITLIDEEGEDYTEPLNLTDAIAEVAKAINKLAEATKEVKLRGTYEQQQELIRRTVMEPQLVRRMLYKGLGVRFVNVLDEMVRDRLRDREEGHPMRPGSPYMDAQEMREEK